MQAVFQGKQYLKINVNQYEPAEEVKETLKTEISETVSAPAPKEEKSEQKIEEGEKP